MTHFIEKRIDMEKNSGIIDFKERKEEKMVKREEEKIDEIVSYFKNMEISECVEKRIQETCRKICERSAKRD